MKRCFVIILLASISVSVASTSALSQKIAGMLRKTEEASDGYMLFAPLMSKETYLINPCGNVLNKWQSEYNPGNTAYLLPNGNLFRTTRLANSVITGGGGGGGLEILDWQSNVVWTYSINSETQRLHHDISILPNGNVLVIVWDLKTEAESIAAGRNPAKLSNKVIWQERIMELKPVLPNDAEIVWEWSLWDHMIQDFDPSKANYGIVGDHPELVDLNFTQTPAGANDWIHANAIDYNPDLDQIVLSSPFLNEFWIIDHSTTTEEAASHSGGNSGKGGDLLYRWGNQQAYGKGTADDQKLFGQHHVHWIEKEFDQGGGIMVFNNQVGSDFSSVDIIHPEVDESGTYILTDGKFGPAEQQYIYTADPAGSLYSAIMSGAEMLEGGNLLVCSSIQGYVVEVTPTGEIAWEYKVPITTTGIVGRDLPADQPFISDRIFRAIKYSPDYAGFVGKNLEPDEPIEGEPWPECAIPPVAVESRSNEVMIFPNPAAEKLNIKLPEKTDKIDVRILTPHGAELLVGKGLGELALDISGLQNGLFILMVNNTSHKIVKSK